MTDSTADAVATQTVSDGTGTSARRRGWRRKDYPRRRHTLLSVASVVAGLALWQLLAETGLVNRTLSSSPTDVVRSFAKMSGDGTLPEAIVASARLYGVGLGLSIVIGIVFGIVMGWWRTTAAIFDPWVAVLYSTPLVALLPMIIVWFGVGFAGQVVMVVLVSVFPLLVNVMGGTRQVDDDLLRLARSFGASQIAVLRSLVLPSLVPYIVAGVRLAVGTGLIGMVISEYFEGTDGIGGIILKSGVQLDFSGAFVGVFMLAATALILTGLIRALERRIDSWRDA